MKKQGVLATTSVTGRTKDQTSGRNNNTKREAESHLENYNKMVMTPEPVSNRRGTNSRQPSPNVGY